MNKKYTTVIFDLDGTLMNTLDDLTAATNYALELHHYPIRTTAEIRRFIGNGIRNLIIRATSCRMVNEREFETIPGKEISEAEMEAVFSDFQQYYIRHCNDHTGPYPGIMELLHELKKRGIRLGICSNKNRPAVERLNELHFEGMIDEAAGVDEVTPIKPDPTMALSVLKALGATREETLYVGDSQTDLQTAQNTGLRCVTVLWGFRDREELLEAGATDFIEKPEELLRYLE